MGNLSQKEKENALNEVRILASLKTDTIVGYKEAFFEDSSTSLCLVMEFADDGDLYQKILKQQKANQLMDEKEIWRVIIEMTRALKILHEKRIFHRDLKSANVFLNRNGSSKLGDLNVSKVAKKGLLYTQTGTPYYASPEVWKDQPYDSKSDIWSLGCCLYYLLRGEPPFEYALGSSGGSIALAVLSGKYSWEGPGVCDCGGAEDADEFRALVDACLTLDQAKRPSVKELIKRCEALLGRLEASNAGASDVGAGVGSGEDSLCEAATEPE